MEFLIVGNQCDKSSELWNLLIYQMDVAYAIQTTSKFQVLVRWLENDHNAENIYMYEIYSVTVVIYISKLVTYTNISHICTETIQTYLVASEEQLKPHHIYKYTEELLQASLMNAASIARSITSIAFRRQ